MSWKSALSCLPRGTGLILGGYANGKLMDRNYKITAEQIGHRVDREHGDDINHFPIETARTRGSLYLVGILTCSVIGYGWALNQHSRVAIALILQFIQEIFQSSIYVFSNTLLIDILSETPSTAAATASITRCALAALGTATVQPLINVLGRG
jgi:MFS family permease